MNNVRLFVIVFDKATAPMLAEPKRLAKQLTALGITKDDKVEIHIVGRSGYTLIPSTVGFDVSWLSVVAVLDPGPRTRDDTAVVVRAILTSQATATADGFSHTTRILVLTGEQSSGVAKDLGHLGSVTVGAPAAPTGAVTPPTTATLRPISPAPKNFVDDFVWHRLELTDAPVYAGFTNDSPERVAELRSVYATAVAGNVDAMRDLGQLCTGHGFGVAARQWYRWAADRGDAKSTHSLGQLIERSSPVEAEAYYKRALQRGYKPALLALGSLASERGNHLAAESYYRAAMEALPTAHNGAYGLAKALEMQGKFGDAAEAYERLVRFGDRNALRRFAELRAAEGRRTDAETLFGRYESSGGKVDAGTYFHLAETLKKRGANGEAAFWYRKAVDDAYYGGRASYELGSYLLGQSESAAFGNSDERAKIHREGVVRLQEAARRGHPDANSKLPLWRRRKSK